MGRAKENEENLNTKPRHVKRIFTYGTLKKGFSNHVLLEDMISTGDALYLGVYTTVQKLPLVCGPYRVPFLLHYPGSGEQVTGELYSVSAAALDRMDELEGIEKGHYERLPISVQPKDDCNDDILGYPDGVMKTEAYYAHESYAKEMWEKNQETGFKEYTNIEANGYVKRNERQPCDFTFLDHIRVFLSSSD